MSFLTFIHIVMILVICKRRLRKQYFSMIKLFDVKIKRVRHFTCVCKFFFFFFLFFLFFLLFFFQFLSIIRMGLR